MDLGDIDSYKRSTENLHTSEKSSDFVDQDYISVVDSSEHDDIEKSSDDSKETKSPTDDGNDPTDIICSKHKIICHLYCLRDEVFVCLDCLKFTHQPSLCRCEAIEKVHAQKRQEIEIYLRKDENFMENLRTLEEFENRKEGELRRNQKYKNSIISHKDECIEYIDEQKRKIGCKIVTKSEHFREDCINTLKHLEDSEKDLDQVYAKVEQTITEIDNPNVDLEDLLKNDFFLIEDTVERCLKDTVKPPKQVLFSLVENNISAVFSDIG